VGADGSRVHDFGFRACAGLTVYFFNAVDKNARVALQNDFFFTKQGRHAQGLPVKVPAPTGSRRSGQLLGVIVLLLTMATLRGGDAEPKNLIKCPDCGKDVSRRAVHCPACGCPGSAIVEEANRVEDARVPKPVVSLVAPNGGGSGVAIEQDGKFVVTRLEDLGTGESLTIKSVNGQDIPYSAVEVAESLPLIRFTVQGDAVAFLPVSAKGEQVGFLNGSGHGSAPDAACVAVDAAGAASALIDPKSGQALPLSGKISWIAIRPADFREQVGLLAQARAESLAGGLKPETRARLSNASWTSQYFKSTSKELLTKNP